MSMRWDWSNTFKKISTWLGLLSGGSGSALLAYATMPDRVQNLVPDAALLALGVLTVVPAFAVGVATAYKQSGLGTFSKVEITTTTKVEGDVSPEKAAELVEAVAPTTEVPDAGRS